jgi:hypothetical protein
MAMSEANHTRTVNRIKAEAIAAAARECSRVDDWAEEMRRIADAVVAGQHVELTPQEHRLAQEMLRASEEYLQKARRWPRAQP